MTIFLFLLGTVYPYPYHAVTSSSIFELEADAAYLISLF